MTGTIWINFQLLSSETFSGCLDSSLHFMYQLNAELMFADRVQRFNI